MSLHNLLQMKNYTKSEIQSLIDRFEVQKLPENEWLHEAHLVVAIWYCSKYPFEKAIELTRNNIIRHNESVGKPNTYNQGYHETITLFWLLIARRFVTNSNYESITQTCNAFINSEFSSKTYLLEYYSRQRVFSLEARYHWMEPDKKSL